MAVSPKGADALFRQLETVVSGTLSTAPPIPPELWGWVAEARTRGVGFLRDELLATAERVLATLDDPRKRLAVKALIVRRGLEHVAEPAQARRLGEEHGALRLVRLDSPSSSAALRRLGRLLDEATALLADALEPVPFEGVAGIGQDLERLPALTPAAQAKIDPLDMVVALESAGGRDHAMSSPQQAYRLRRRAAIAASARRPASETLPPRLRGQNCSVAGLAPAVAELVARAMRMELLTTAELRELAAVARLGESGQGVPLTTDTLFGVLLDQLRLHALRGTRGIGHLTVNVMADALAFGRVREDGRYWPLASALLHDTNASLTKRLEAVRNGSIIASGMNVPVAGLDLVAEARRLLMRGPTDGPVDAFLSLAEAGCLYRQALGALVDDRERDFKATRDRGIRRASHGAQLALAANDRRTRRWARLMLAELRSLDAGLLSASPVERREVAGTQRGVLEKLLSGADRDVADRAAMALMVLALLAGDRDELLQRYSTVTSSVALLQRRPGLNLALHVVAAECAQQGLPLPVEHLPDLPDGWDSPRVRVLYSRLVRRLAPVA